MTIEAVKAGAIQKHLNGDLDGAEKDYRLMISQGMGDHDVFNNLGLICLDKSRIPEAIEYFRAAISIYPEFPEAHSALGSALISVNPLESEALFNAAIKLRPDFYQAKYNLANLFWKTGRIEQAIETYRVAIKDNPHFVHAHFNMSMALLLNGHLKEGFAEYEWRLKRTSYINQIKLPDRKWLWDGNMETGYQVVLVPEPGYGDLFHFLRYGKLLRQQGVYVVLRAKESLRHLLDSSECYDRFLAMREPISPETQRWYPLFSLPYLFNTTLETIPADIPYIHPDEERVSKWEKKLDANKTFRIGINWQGNPHHEKTMNEGRSVPLEFFASLSKIPNVTLLSLQKFNGLDQLSQCSFKDEILVFDEEVYPSEPAFSEAAALIRTLDLVITSDTSIAHLAGAMGVPVWVVLSHIAEWRWLRHGHETAWYPTMKLYRQPAQGDWKSVFEKIAEDVKTIAE